MLRIGAAVLTYQLAGACYLPNGDEGLRVDVMVDLADNWGGLHGAFGDLWTRKFLNPTLAVEKIGAKTAKTKRGGHATRIRPPRGGNLFTSCPAQSRGC